MIKKSFIFVLFVIIGLTAANVNAKEHYQGPVENSNVAEATTNSPFLGAQRLTIKELSAQHDDDYVILQGYIVKKIRGEKFLFKDSTGEIEIEIDHKRNYLLENVNEKTLVEISGEYDRNTFERDEIEVKNLKIIKQN